MTTIMDIPTMPMPAPANPALLSFADSIVDFAAAGGTVDELRATIAEARKPKAKPARKPAKTVDPTVGTGALVMTLSGKLMKSEAGTITKGQRRNLARFGITAVDGLSMAQASDIYFNLKAAA